jgi:hypothetical protein
MSGIGGSAFARWIGLAALLALIACSSKPEHAQIAKPIDLKQCLRQLDHLDGLEYRRLPNKVAGPSCGLRGAVEVRNIGVPVKGIGPLSCPMTARLHEWIRKGLQPAARKRFGQEVVGVESYGTYACRPRNNMAGGLPSEHSWANAIDIAGFRLADGRQVSVLKDWNGKDKAARRFLHDIRKEGCKAFNMVLGPDDNDQHRDHLHFDMGQWDNCR